MNGNALPAGAMELDRLDVDGNHPAGSRFLSRSGRQQFFYNHFDNTAMIPLDPLLKRLAGLPGMESGCKRLVVVLGQLGDFDSMECIQGVTG